MINKTNMKQLRYLKLLAILNLSIFWTVGLNRNYAFAQNNIVPDETLGNGKSRVVPFEGNSAIDTIQGGAISDSNLFHSFQEFNVNEDGSAYFANPEGITDIFSRVTGNNPSNIFGKLGVLGDANLFLINPNGIVFGENASLDVGGSFVASTANGIEFGEQGSFSASNPQAPRLLNVNPSALFFNQVAAQPIVNKSRADAGRDPSNSFDTFGLRVPDGKSLLLVGGDIIIDAGGIVAFGGRVDLASIAGKGEVELNQDRNNLSLNVVDTASRGNISLTNDAGVIVTAGDGGDIAIAGRNIDILGESTLNAGILSQLGSLDAQAGDITLDATGSIRISGDNTFIFNNIDSEATGDTGGINITTGSLFVSDGAQIQSLVYGQGNAGIVKIDARDTMTFNGENTEGFPSGIFSIIGENGQGKTGGIELTGNSVFITNRAQLGSFTEGKRIEKSGDIVIKAKNQVSLINSIIITEITEKTGEGNAGNIEITADNLLLKDGSSLLADTENEGNAGDIKLKVNNEIILKGEGPAALDRSQIVPSQISATVESDGAGQGGNIDIATGLLSLNDDGFISSDTSGDGKAGNLNIKTSNLTLRNDARVSVTTFGSGDAGNLNIITDFFRLEDTSQLGAITFGEGDAGTLKIKASEIIQLIGSLDENRIQNGGLFASAIEGSGNGGDLILETNKLIVQDGAIISASNFQSTNQSPPGTGSPGNLSIDAGSVILDNKGSITTATSVGSDENKGNISINARDNLTANNSTISTTSQQSSGGAINITAKDIRLFGDSDIATNVFSGEGGGGNINLTANTIIALDDSDILSFAGDGKGGDITFNTEAFFSKPLYRPTATNSNANALTELDTNNRVDVNASGTVSGTIAGIPDTTFIQDSLTELPENQIDTNVLVASSCIVRNNQQNGTFFITGASGLPQNPSDAPLSNYSTGSVQSIPITSEKLPSSTTQTWKIGDPIVEPSGAYQLPNGKILLSRECSN